MEPELKENGEIYYNGKKIGELIFDQESGHVFLLLNIESVSDQDRQLIVFLLNGFVTKSNEIKRRKNSLQKASSKETSKDNLVHVKNSNETKMSFIVKLNGEQWQFHKNDADPWPSKLHGHHAHFVLDAITGKVYDSVTRDFCYVMRQKELDKVQARLLSSKDFAEKAKKLF